MTEHVQQLTRLLQAWSNGETIDQDVLGGLVYDELHAIAVAFARGAGDTLRPTAVVNEAWLRLQAQAGKGWSGRKHFYAVAAKAMRHVLADYARRAGADKRGHGRQRITLDPGVTPTEVSALDVLALDDAIAKLATLDARQAQIVELRFFAGLTVEEVADLLSVSASTVKDEWRVARAWLRREFVADSDRDPERAGDGP